MFEYIQILLPKHKCVTVPGFGAFILNKEELQSSGVGEVSVPRCTVVFNSRLQHDDGVLTSHIQSVHGISYEKASKELANATGEIRNSLLRKKVVVCGLLGQIELTDGNIVFTADDRYIFPQHYGLSALGLETLTAINKSIVKEVKVVSLRKRLTIAASGVAVVLLLTLPSISITDSATSDVQQAGYLKSLITPEKLATENESKVVAAPIEEFGPTTVATPASQIQVVDNHSAVHVAAPASGRTYYLIVGGEPTSDRAERALNKFKASGFSDARIISSSERYRIYVASFGDKKEAEEYLVRFRKENPQYASAWIHSQRN